jgi:hypothetical protein
VCSWSALLNTQALTLDYLMLQLFNYLLFLVFSPVQSHSVPLLLWLLLPQTAPGNRSGKGSGWVVEGSVFEQRKTDSDAHDLYDTPKVTYSTVSVWGFTMVMMCIWCVQHTKVMGQTDSWFMRSFQL